MVTMLDRRSAVAALVAAFPDALIVSGLGSASYDLHAAGDRPGNYYLWGAMGAAALVGLGLSQAQPGRQVIVITGDGEQLMGLGGLATIGIARPQNLTIIVLDNGHFGETGMQVSHTGCGLALDAVAAACGFARTGIMCNPSDLERVCIDMREPLIGPCLYVAKIEAENLPRSLPPRDAVHVKNRFRAHLGFATA
jgi:thiamine pyrophosphate-dependent acetolactate synthase large subunit-like protein